MLKYFALFTVFFAVNLSFAQDLTATIEMPEAVTPGEEYPVNVTIKKGAINSYIKFLQKLPPGFSATAADVSGGSFSFSDSVIKIVWLFPPASSSFSFSYKIKAADILTGNEKIGGKIFYFFNTNRESFKFKREYINGSKAATVVVLDTSKQLSETVKPVVSTVRSVPVVVTDSALSAIPSDTLKVASVILDTIQSVEITSIDNISDSQAISVDSTTVNSLIASSEAPSSDSIVSSTQLKDTSTSVAMPPEIVNIVDVPVVPGKVMESDTDTVKTSTAPATIATITDFIKPVTPIASDTLVQSDIAIESDIAIADETAALETKMDTLPIAVIALDDKVEPEKMPIVSEVVVVVEATPISIKQDGDLRYCVQVGAFLNEVPLATANKFLSVSARGVKNLKESNGMTTFIVGDFNSRDAANSLKNSMTEKGFEGAYVISYSLNKSNEEQEDSKIEKIDVQLVSDKPVVVKKEEPINPTIPPTTSRFVKEGKPVSSPSTPASTAIKTYRIQLGAFKEGVPLKTANKFLKVGAKGVKNLKDSRGLTTYTVGNFSSRDEANNYKHVMREKGFADAYIIMFENGKYAK